MQDRQSVSYILPYQRVRKRLIALALVVVLGVSGLVWSNVFVSRCVFRTATNHPLEVAEFLAAASKQEGYSWISLNGCEGMRVVLQGHFTPLEGSMGFIRPACDSGVLPSTFSIAETQTGNGGRYGMALFANMYQDPTIHFDRSIQITGVIQRCSATYDTVDRECSVTLFDDCQETISMWYISVETLHVH